MKEKIEFVALGGAQSIGTSCYYLSVDGCRFLLDCGGIPNKTTKVGAKIDYLPRFSLETLSDIDAVLISHSHYDHIGFLPEFHNMAKNVPIYASLQTKALAYYQMWDNADNLNYNLSEKQRIQKEIILQDTLDSITEVPFIKKQSFPRFSLTFYEAGHIPGAAMILIETKNHKILYTGDFAKSDTPLVMGYRLPEHIEADTLIICGTNAENPGIVNCKDLDIYISRMSGFLMRNGPKLLKVKQLTKGLEVMSLLGKAMTKGIIREQHIFVDSNILKAAERLEEMGLTVLNQYCRVFRYNGFEDGAYITGNNRWNNYLNSKDVDFSLHATYLQIKELIKKINPLNAIVVHTGKQFEECNKHILEMDIRTEFSDKMNFYYPKECETYII